MGSESSQSPGEQEVLELVAYVTGSKYRTMILEELAGGAKQPSDIAEAGDVARSHISRALKELRNRDLVESYGDDSRSKLYVLTELGKKVDERRCNEDL